MVEPTRRKFTWGGEFLHEAFRMPRRHIFVFLIATLVFVILEVEFAMGSHLTPILKLLGVMGVLCLLWVAWRT